MQQVSQNEDVHYEIPDDWILSPVGYWKKTGVGKFSFKPLEGVVISRPNFVLAVIEELDHHGTSRVVERAEGVQIYIQGDQTIHVFLFNLADTQYGYMRLDLDDPLPDPTTLDTIVRIVLHVTSRNYAKTLGQF